MRKTLLFVPIMLSTLIYSGSAFACEYIWQRMVFNEEKVTLNTDLALLLKSRQCTESWSSHDEAIQSGISIGTKIYGVPLKIGGNFDQNKIKEWKNTNCKSTDINIDDQKRYSIITKYVPERVFESYEACLAFQKDEEKGLKCWANAETDQYVSFAAKWSFPDGTNTTLPKVTRSFVDGAVRSDAYAPEAGKLFNKGDLIPAGVSYVPLRKLSSGGFVYASLVTDRGACQAIAKPPATYTIKAKISGRAMLPHPVSQTFANDRDTDSCGTNESADREFCIAADRVTGYSTNLRCTRCGSGITNVVATKANCYTVYAQFKSCGFTGIRTCDGTGCLKYDITISGEKDKEEGIPAYQAELTDLRQSRFTIQYPPERIPRDAKSVKWFYEVQITEKQGENEFTIALSQADQAAGKYQSRITQDGSLQVWVAD